MSKVQSSPQPKAKASDEKKKKSEKAPASEKAAAPEAKKEAKVEAPVKKEEKAPSKEKKAEPAEDASDGEKKEKKKEEDPNAPPKQPINAYMKFTKDYRPLIKESTKAKGKEIKGKELTDTLSKIWKDENKLLDPYLSAPDASKDGVIRLAGHEKKSWTEVKDHYKSIYAENKKVYDTKMKEWKERVGEEGVKKYKEEHPRKSKGSKKGEGKKRGSKKGKNDDDDGNNEEGGDDEDEESPKKKTKKTKYTVKWSEPKNKAVLTAFIKRLIGAAESDPNFDDDALQFVRGVASKLTEGTAAASSSSS